MNNIIAGINVVSIIVCIITYVITSIILDKKILSPIQFNTLNILRKTSYHIFHVLLYFSIFFWGTILLYTIVKQ